MRLSDEQLAALRTMALDAFPTEDDLDLWLREHLSVRLARIAKPAGLEIRMDILLQWLETRNRTCEFIDALIKDRPHLAAALVPLGEVAKTRAKGLDYVKERLDEVRGRLMDRPWAFAAAMLIMTACAAGVAWFLVIPPDFSKPLTPIHATTIWEKAFIVRGERIAYTSPDRTYQIIEERLSKAESSIQIAMFEFTSADIGAMLEKAIERNGVKITLLIGSRTPTNDSGAVLDRLAQMGAKVIYAQRASRSRIYHSSLIIIDTRWVLIQSGGLTPTSVPPPSAESGNRAVGIAIEDPALAGHFAQLFNLDKTTIETTNDPDSQGGGENERDPIYPPFDPVPKVDPLRIGGSTSDAKGEIDRPTRILPVNAPENYATNVLALLESAKESIDIAAPYAIPGERAPTLQKVLEAIRTARSRNPHLKVRLMLGRFPKRSAVKLRDFCPWLSTDEMRALDPRSGLNLVSKLLVVDRRVAVVGSANWSEGGYGRNREIGVLIDSPPIAGWYSGIFDKDWDHSVNLDAIGEEEGN